MHNEESIYNFQKLIKWTEVVFLVWFHIGLYVSHYSYLVFMQLVYSTQQLIIPYSRDRTLTVKWILIVLDQLK